MDKEDFATQMMTSTRESGPLTKQTEKVFTHTRTVQSTRVIGKMISSMDMEWKPGWTNPSMRGISSSARSMEKVTLIN